jgi:multidrug efflux system outer membrane protein
VERRRIANPTHICGGALRSGLRLAEAQEQEMLLTYQQTIMNAFQEVSNSLVAYQKNREFREQQ